MVDLLKARSLVQQLSEVLNESTPPAPSDITTAEEFKRALSAATSETVLSLAPAFVFTEPLVLSRPVRIIGHVDAGTSGRQNGTNPAPRFTMGITIPPDSQRVRLAGLEVTNADAPQNIIDDQGIGTEIDYCRLLGSVTNGQRRAIAGNGRHAVYSRNWIRECFSINMGKWTDSQAICVWNTPGPVTIVDNDVEGSSEGIMIGGSDPSSSANDPADVSIISNRIAKDPAWKALGYNVKNGLELKNVRRCTIEDNDIEYAWAAAQAGYLLVFTVHNQEGRDWTATIQDVTCTGNRLKHGAGAIIISGLEEIKEDKAGVGKVAIGQVRPSERMRKVTIELNKFDDVTPATWGKVGASNRLILVSAGPADLTINANDFGNPAGFNSVVYFTNGPKAENMKLTGNRWPTTKYGIFGAGVTVNKARDAAWPVYTNNGTLADNTEVTAA
jgi:hypothetical protein